MKIKVTKTTGVEKLRKANSFTSGKDSKMSLGVAYRLGHSPIRTQKFEIELTDIPLFVASQLVRQTQGVQWWQKSKRTDRGGKDFVVQCLAISTDLGNILDRMESGEEVDPNEWLNQLEFINKLSLEFDRYAPTDLYCELNAEALMNMAHKRLCTKASKETREIVTAICELVEEQDPDLFNWLVPSCVMYGFCRESKPCGYYKTEKGKAERDNIIELCQ